MTAHFDAVAGDQKVFARREQLLGIVPRRADQRDPASQSLEHPYRRDAGQHPNIWPPRYVDGCGGCGKRIGDPEVRQVAGEFRPCFGKRPPRVRGIAYPVHACRET